MPWVQMTDQQLQEFLEAMPKLQELPGVQFVQPEYLSGRHRRVAIAVYLARQHMGTLRQLPATVARLPVAAIIEDPRTGEILEVINLSDSYEE